MYDGQPLPCAPNSNSIAQAVDDAIRFLRINKNSSDLLLSDAAKYMVAAGAILTCLYSKLPHVAMKLRNCAMNVKSHFKDVDQLIAKVKSATLKNNTRQAKDHTLLLHDGKAGQMLPYIRQRIFL